MACHFFTGVSFRLATDLSWGGARRVELLTMSSMESMMIIIRQNICQIAIIPYSHITFGFLEARLMFLSSRSNRLITGVAIVDLYTESRTNLRDGHDECNSLRFSGTINSML